MQVYLTLLQVYCAYTLEVIKYNRFELLSMLYALYICNSNSKIRFIGHSSVI